MRRLTLLLFALCGLLSPLCGQVNPKVFDLFDPTHPGLAPMREALAQGDTLQAAEALLHYYRTRQGVVSPDFDPDRITLSEEHRRWADEALDHRFFVHTGYQPSLFYGEDIDWEYWPVRDNELRWQLHRHKWWVPMGKAYRLTGDERYAREWRLQYLDWIEKNPLDGFFNTEKGPGEGTVDLMTAPNSLFAWRPLEVSDRLEFQIQQLLLFLPSEAVDGPFLSHFLVNYHRHCTHLQANLSAHGNHRLFQAQRLLYGAVFFPEFREAAAWREEMIGILNSEIEKQVLPDGMQYELDPHYHLEAINIFFGALRMCDANGLREAFPVSYLQRVEQMIEIHYNYSYPDLSTPMFSDAKLHERDYTFPYYAEWLKVFPENEMIRHIATEGREGALPDHLSKAFPFSGFYVLRNGWDEEATVMTLKAGPPAFWHCQPDNGTFELWVKGRNFFPDSGSYVYAGDEEINRQRAWFRQTRVHNTLTLDGKNLEETSSRCLEFRTDDERHLLAVENPSYAGLNHRRTVHFIEGKFFVIIDEALGESSGEVALNYHLIEGEHEIDTVKHTVTTRFADRNNLQLRTFGAQRMQMECRTGRVSRTYRHYAERPWIRFMVEKSASPAVRFVTLLVPFEGRKAPRTSLTLQDEELRIKVGRKRYNIAINE